MKVRMIGGCAALVVLVFGSFGVPASAADTTKPAVAADAAKAAAAKPPTMAEMALARLQAVIGGAQSIAYTSTIKTLAPSKDPKVLKPVMLQVSAKLQQPDGYRIEISKAGSLVYVMTSGKSSGYVVDVPGKRYAAFEKPDSQTGFQMGVQTAGRGLLDGSAASAFIVFDQLNDPHQFDVSSAAPPGTFTTVAAPALLNGKRLIKIVQSATMQPGRKIAFRLYVDPTTSLPSHIELEADDKGKDLVGYQEDFTTWTIGSSPLPVSDFDFVPDAAAKAYTAPVDPRQPPVLANGALAPDFTVTTADGKSIKLSAYAGKVVVLDFWATWCGPCQRELPLISGLADEYTPKGVVFLAVCSWDQNAQFLDWTKAHSSLTNITFAFDPVGVDGDKSIAIKQYSVSGIPTQFIIGKDGHVVGSMDYYDPSDRHQHKLIDKALAAQ